MKVRWAVCKSQDLQNFKAELVGHRGAIEVLLLSLHMSVDTDSSDFIEVADIFIRSKTSIQAREQETRHKTLLGIIQDASFQVMGKISALSGGIARSAQALIAIIRTTRLTIYSSIEQGRQLLECSAKVLYIWTYLPIPNMVLMLCRSFNIRIFQMTCQIYNILSQIPGQIERQQPVFMIDALGMASPFHLEFVRSLEVSLLWMQACS